MLDAFLGWIQDGSFVAIAVTIWLFVYMVTIIFIFLYRYSYLKSLIKRENEITKGLLSGSLDLPSDSAYFHCTKNGLNPKLMQACLEVATKDATSMLTALSAIASTSPFVGLFGTVVGVLQAFAGFKDGVTLSIVAPAISEALIVTAMGIVVAIPAYWAYLLIKRKAYELTTVLKIQIDIVTAKKIV